MVQEQSKETKKRGWVEKVGNKLPDPLTLFVLFSLAGIIISAIASALPVSVVHPGTKKTVAVVSLLTPDGIRRIVTEAVKNFTDFPPLGTLLVAMLGVGADAGYVALVPLL